MSEAEDDEDGGGGEGWLVSYADLMTLLFAAFVVLYGTIEEGTQDRVIGVISAIREAFVEVSDVIPKDQKIGDIARGEFVFKAFEGQRPETEGAVRFLVKDDPKIAIDRDKNLVEKLLDQMATGKDGIDMGQRQAMIVEETERGLSIKFMGAYFYKPDEFKLNRYGEERLIRLGRMLRKLKTKILIEGHVDSGSNLPRGVEDRFQLGALRSGYAAELLIEKVGFPAYLIDTVSWGDERPIAENRSVSERVKNHRIEIKLLYE